LTENEQENKFLNTKMGTTFCKSKDDIVDTRESWTDEYMSLQYCNNYLPDGVNISWNYSLPVVIKYAVLGSINSKKKKLFICPDVMKQIFEYAAIRHVHRHQTGFPSSNCYTLPFVLMNDTERIVWLCETRRQKECAKERIEFTEQNPYRWSYHFRRQTEYVHQYRYDAWDYFCNHHDSFGNVIAEKHKVFL